MARTLLGAGQDGTARISAMTVRPNCVAYPGSSCALPCARSHQAVQYLCVGVESGESEIAAPMQYQPGKQDVDIDKLIPPPSRPFADPGKLARHGPFDWKKYTPIIVETDGTSLWLMDGMTRVENARRAGITSLPANVYRR